MYAKQYEITLPADYDMRIIRKRVADGGHVLDDRAGLGLKASSSTPMTRSDTPCRSRRMACPAGLPFRQRTDSDTRSTDNVSTEGVGRVDSEGGREGPEQVTEVPARTHGTTGALAAEGIDHERARRGGGADPPVQCAAV
ncbi:DUF4865 family protein [Nonomuraea insulae]|uniref:DUF4865 family protein n=1 Tax=Nonomuraea insulae TaxID=1616787 RepID=A0ABW1CT52_9ACTN